MMTLLAWIAVGLIAGFVASLSVNQRGESLPRDLALGVIGAFVGSAIFNAYGEPGVRGLNPYSVGVSAIGAVVTLISFHAIVRNQRPKR